jgi:hypothetical protein
MFFGSMTTSAEGEPARAPLLARQHGGRDQGKQGHDGCALKSV